jgi:8-oxo-dGTP diphosphatase
MARAVAEFAQLLELIRRQEELLQAAESSAALPEAVATSLRAHLDSHPTAIPFDNLRILTNRPKVGVGVILCSIQHPGRVLIGERRGSHGAGRWALPGGHLEGGESWEACATREIQEETGVLLPESRFAFEGVTNDIMTAEELHYVTIFLVATLNAAETAAIVNGEPEKCMGWEWLTWAQIETKLLFVPLENFIKKRGAEMAARSHDTL